MARFRMRLLGSFELFDSGGRPLEISARKNRAMLAILALSPGGSASRERLSNLLWSDRADPQARSSLRQSLALLRNDLSRIGPSPLSAVDDRLVLDLAAVDVDVLEFVKFSKSADPAPLHQAVDLFGGELLADMTIRDPGFEEWVAAERARLHRIALEATEKLWAKVPVTGRAGVARRLVALDPIREASHLALMRSYTETGETGLALQQYAACADILKSELGIAPGPEIDAFRQRILVGGRDGAEGTTHAGSPHPAARQEATPSGGDLRTTEPPPRLPDKPSIAVLPFVNLSGDQEQDYFADGVVEEMTIALSRFDWLFVIARNSSFAYKGRAVDVKQVGQELGVRYVLEGSVRKAANRVRISGQLIDAISGVHLWADRFDGPIDNIFDLQDRVTADVVGAIAPKLEQAEIERVNRKPTDNLDAYDVFLRGMAGLHRWSREGNKEALKYFYHAIDLDPGYASAYGVAARAYVQRGAGGWTVDRAHDVEEATRLACRAVELGQDDARALATAGFALADMCGRIADGNAWIDRALELNPNLAIAWVYSGWVKASLGQPDLALERLATAKRLSPNDPQAFSLLSAQAIAHFVAGRYEEALAHAEMAERSKPGFLLAHLTAAVCSAHTGRLSEAAKAVARLRATDPSASIRSVLTLQAMPPADLERWVEGLRLAGLPEGAGLQSWA